MNTEEYFKEIENQVKAAYVVAEEARRKGLDPLSKVEIPLAMSLAERVTGLLSVKYPQLSDKRVVNRIKELEKEYGLLDHAVALKIAEEIVKEKFCKFKDHLEAVDAGIRAGFAYITVGVVSSPLEGFTYFELKKTRTGEDYISPYYSGPVRSAGGTAAAFSLLLVDHLREIFGYAKYDPDEKEVKRTITEINDFHERVSNLQYLPSEKEIEFIARNIPIQVDGEPSEEKEVSNYKDLDRIKTNFMRNGVCLILAEGLCQKAAKILKILMKLRKNGFKLSGWDFLESFVEFQKQQAKEKKEKISSAVYIQDLVAGRPVLGHPSRQGGFRLRYGRSRFSGLSSMAMSPYTMDILYNYIAIGTQLKYEGPGKSSAMTPCDSIDGPIVKLGNGSVIKIDSSEKLRRAREKEILEILHLGDFLVNYGEYFNRGKRLQKPGYVEEWYSAELEKKSVSGIAKELVKNPWFKINFDSALEISKNYDVPLHPGFIYYWSHINKELFFSLIDWIAHSRIVDEKLLLPYNKTEQERFAKGKRVLELIGIEHEVVIENVIIDEENTKAFLFQLGIEDDDLEEKINLMIRKIGEENDVLKIINLFSKYKVKDKAGSYIGARMGRPEKAKLRKLTGSPNVLFPVGEEGGRLRSVNEAIEKGSIKADFPIYFCKNCNKETIYFRCEVCDSECEKRNYCTECHQTFSFEKCPEHAKGQAFMPRRIDSKSYFNCAIKKLDLLPDELPKLIKGVKGTSNKQHIPENLAKGILRAAYNLQVNKDGTIRYDVTEQALTHFKPREIMTSVERLRELGYEKDIYGKKLENENQIVELFPLDVILPSCQESNDEKADDVFLKITRFIDHLLVSFYNLKQFYRIESKEDLIGQIVVGLAPHTSAGIIGRIIGFSKTQGCIASPLWHAAQRRDCVHPETKLFFYDEESKEIFYDSIGEYVENLIKDGADTKKIDSLGTLRVENKRNLFALGINPVTHNLEKKRIKYFIKGPETEGWVKITTATNREYIMTPTHKFMHLEDGKFKFKNAEETEVGDRVPVLENFNFDSGVDSINLIKLFKEELTEKEQKEILVIKNEKECELLGFSEADMENLQIRHKFSCHVFPNILKIDKNLMRIFGYYAAEGYSRQNKSVSQISFRICNKEMQEELVRLIKEVFGVEASLGEENSKITICSKIVYYLFNCLNTGGGAYEKRVPRFIFGLEKDLIKEYVSAYFEGDGSVIKDKGILVFYSVSRSMLDDLALLLAKFKIFGRYFRTGLRMPGKKVLEIYRRLGKEPKEHILNHLVLGVHDSFKLKEILNLVNKRKLDNLICIRNAGRRYVHYNNKQILLASQSDYVIDYVKKVERLEDNKNSYCVEIDWNELEERNVLWGEQIINTRCEGDETCVMLLLDALINFSREYLPAHRGGTQDAPLVITVGLNPAEVDDMIFDMDVVWKYPLELYEAAEKEVFPWDIKIEQIRNRLGTEKQYSDFGFTHDVDDINNAVRYSAYKSIPNMVEKVAGQMKIAEIIRAVDTSDVARLVIDRHFIRDIRGNLRKFSQQEFRCSKCNEKYRRPPLIGKCLNCGGKIIFTIFLGSIVKYLEPAIQLAEKYNVPAYLKQNLELTKSYIESIFGKEKEKQEALGKWV